MPIYSILLFAAATFLYFHHPYIVSTVGYGMARFDNKRERPEKINWIQENFKDAKLRTSLYLQYGLDILKIPEKIQREILANFESQYAEIGYPNTLTKAATLLKYGLIQYYDVADKTITGVYNMAPNLFTYKKRY